jgi:hypothetical protein
MNPNKCAFGVSAGQFLDFLIHERGFEVGCKSISAIDNIKAPSNKKELQSLIGKINFIKRFISNMFERIHPFTPLLKLKADQKFVWGECRMDIPRPITQVGTRTDYSMGP